MASSDLKAPPDAEALARVAERFGTPTYVYFEAVLRRQCARLRRLAGGLPARLLYAMKANPCPALLHVLRDEGLGLDVVSPAERLLAERLGFAPERILFTANNMTDAEMREAHAAGVLLNIGERSRLEKFGRAFPGARVCLRINPHVGGGHHAHVVTAGAHAKFGLAPAEMDDVEAILREHDLHVVGLHQHIGSGMSDPAPLARAARVLFDLAARFPGLAFVNLGGGLGVPYRPEEAALGAAAFRRAVTRPVQQMLAAHPNEELACWLEPGRFLVAQAGVLLTRVNTLKPTPERTFAGTDTGMTHLLRPAIYDAYHAIRNLSNPEGAPRRYDVVGNVCEAGDVLARERMIPAIREGDLLAVLDAGAYGMAMASTYNLRPLPAEVMVRPDGAAELVRRRQTAEDVVGALTSGVPAA